MKSKTRTSSLFFNINKILFFVFLFLLPSQLGKHFFLPFSYLSGIRVDYLSPTLYLVDLIVIALFVFNLKTALKFFRSRYVLFLFLGMALNIALSKSPPLALYGSFRIIEILVVFALGKSLIKSMPPLSILAAFSMSSAVELFLSLSQIITGQSLQGFFYFLGERLMTLSTPGIAKIAVSGQEFLRPYGTFSHPNSLAGFYLLLYFFVLVTKRFERYLPLKYIVLFISSCLIFISFSKTAIITFLALNFAYYLMKKRLTCRICVISRLVVLTALSLMFLYPTGDPVTLKKRVELMGNSLTIIKDNPLTGVGLNNYLLGQSKFVSKFPLFVNQPVHNIFLLFVAETGLLGGLALYHLGKFFKNRLSKDQWLIVGVVLITGMVDHYWLTLIQNILLMGVVFSFTGFQGPSLPGDSKPRSDEVARQIL